MSQWVVSQVPLRSVPSHTNTHLLITSDEPRLLWATAIRRSILAENLVCLRRPSELLHKRQRPFSIWFLAHSYELGVTLTTLLLFNMFSEGLCISPVRVFTLVKCLKAPREPDSCFDLTNRNLRVLRLRSRHTSLAVIMFLFGNRVRVCEMCHTGHRLN